MRCRRQGVLLVATAVLLTTCAAPSFSSSPQGSAPGVRTPPAASGSVAPTASALSSVQPPTATAAPVAAEPPPIALEVVAEDLAAPISIASAPGGWLLVNEQAGRVIAVHPGTGERAVALDLTDRIASGGERGLLGLALHPDWPTDPRAFVHYSDLAGNTVLSELTGSQEDPGPPTLTPDSELILLQVEQPFANHNGGQLAFGPDGHLWMGLGDGGSGGDPLGHGQDTNTLLGSILRLDVATPGEYAIPFDNPFVDGGGQPEIYLSGLRNPWRFSFDDATGALWVADVGQNAYEEVNRIEPGAAAANLGWNLMEASHCFESDGCSSDGLTLPLVEYQHDLGCSVTGGHVYRGSQIDGLAGWYVFGDYCSGLVFGIPSDAAAPTDAALAPRVLLESGVSISAFGPDEGGELFVVGIGQGTVYRIVGAE